MRAPLLCYRTPHIFSNRLSCLRWSNHKPEAPSQKGATWPNNWQTLKDWTNLLLVSISVFICVIRMHQMGSSCSFFPGQSNLLTQLRSRDSLNSSPGYIWKMKGVTVLVFEMIWRYLYYDEAHHNMLVGNCWTSHRLLLQLLSDDKICVAT